MKNLLILGLAACGLASASIIPSLVSVTDNGGGVFAFTYKATLSSDQKLVSANTPYFTIYDFNGLTSVISTPTNWTASVQNLGATPGTVMPTDSASSPNVSFWYSGPDVTPNGAPADLGNFVIGSIYGGQVVGEFSALAVKNTSDITNGTLTANLGSVPVPAPEPATILLGGMALLGVGLLRRKVARS